MSSLLVACQRIARNRYILDGPFVNIMLGAYHRIYGELRYQETFGEGEVPARRSKEYERVQRVASLVNTVSLWNL